jgi:UDP-N-acetylglucosamine diphosphorylase/glucosamine-1-phosphate N-acetyltransferase
MNYILFDDASRENLLPLTFTKPVGDLRTGILTIREKWEKYLDAKTSSLTEGYLSGKYPLIKEKNNILINGSVCPNKELVAEIKQLKSNQALVYQEAESDYYIAINIVSDEKGEIDISNSELIEEIKTSIPHLKINNLWDLFSLNGQAIAEDYELLTKVRKSEKLSDTNRVTGGKDIFVEKGAKVECAILNAEAGPIYIGRDAEIMEGCVIRGPFALCDNAILKMSAKIYGPTTIGPHSRVGGELNNVMILGYSNKSHDGFLGHSVIGEWCNLGADTNTSNLKNTYDEVKLWNYPKKKFISTGLQFCGLIMGDHSKCGINTMFNTGTVVGVSCNLYGSGFMRNFIPSFSWGGSSSGYLTYELEKAVNVAEEVFKRRNMVLSDVDKDILRNLYYITSEYRNIQ